ncbi:hypothetical protein H257_06736 [Aphanomyces astaci]|uniref:DUF7769 domain-containing protein n=1 Tax=Aphanomyces astaci TaxID=112090 RepID=W4GLA0_APHAT|nr:hypothetical protein H257_06736 [Aphanomyces astaci]ETV80465.1 hypothetical protein H257_06736 [Aphanomyces astaci]|eukprot:XP_009830389.1 hypothetical protein H257_06736 [Aphanomyces astaci]
MSNQTLGASPAASVDVAQPPNGHKHLSPTERQAVYEMLLGAAIGAVLPRGVIVKAAKQFGCHERTVSRIWVRAQLSLRHGSISADVRTKLRESAIRAVPLMSRQTLRSLSAACGIPMTSIIRHKKKTPRFKAKSNYVKPFLTSANIEARLRYAMPFVRPLSNGRHSFSNMLDFVHVDEKWFYLTKVKRRYYVYDDEEVAARSVKPKHYITKVMFLGPVARPRYGHHCKKFWDGKVGVWPFVQVSPALRGSKNRRKGTLVTVPQALYFDAVLNKVIPAIMAKFPGGVRRGNVFLQQDNASPHRCVTTELLQAKGVRGIVVANQPPNSPDFNVLDLGFFNLFKVFSTKRQLVQSRSLLGL